MSIETILREAFQDAAADAAPVPGLAAAALRQARRRRTAARSAVAAGAVAAVAVPAGLAASGRDGDSSTVASGDADILPAPEVRELTDDELAAALDHCFGGPGLPPAPTGEPIHGVQVQDPPAPEAVATWVITRPSGEDVIECALTADGDPAVYPVAMVAEDAEFLRVLDPSLSGGRFTDPVTRVTVQPPGEPERDAALWGDFWFYPSQRWIPGGPSCPVDDPIAGDELSPGYVVRGYDAGGDEIAQVWTPAQPGECAPVG